MAKRHSPIDLRDAMSVLQRNMNEVYNIVDASPFIDLPGNEPPEMHRQKMNRVFAMLYTNKLVARRFAPSKLPLVERLESLVKQYSSRDPHKFYPELAAGIKKVAVQGGLDTAFLEHGFLKARQLSGSKRNAPVMPFMPALNNPPKRRRKAARPKKMAGIFGVFPIGRVIK